MSLGLVGFATDVCGAGGAVSEVTPSTVGDRSGDHPL